MFYLSSPRDSYQYALNTEEKLGRKQGKQVTNVEKGKKFVSDKKHICRNTRFKCGKDEH